MFDREKFRQVMLYIIQQSRGNAHLDARKLRELLFRVDFKAYALFGHSITGEAYLAEADGPVPEHFRAILRSMRRAKQIEFVGPKGKRHYVLGPEAKVPLAH